MSLLDQISNALANSGDKAFQYGGLTLATVTNIKDDENLSRVKCLPISAPKEEETDWCYVMAPMGGQECGVCFFPQVNDLVVLAYLGNDPHRPLVLGSFWNSERKPPTPIRDGKVEEYAVRTPKKIDIRLHDEDQKQRVTLTMPSGAVLTVDDGEQKAELRDQDGRNALTLDMKGGKVTLKAEKELNLTAGEKVTIHAGDTRITLEKGGNLSLECKGTLSMNAKGSIKADSASITGKATGKLSLKGGTAEVNADGTLDLKASGITSVKGTLLKLN